MTATGGSLRPTARTEDSASPCASVPPVDVYAALDVLPLAMVLELAARRSS